MAASSYLPYAAGLLAGMAWLAALYTVRFKDLVYSSVSLALLALINAALIALLGLGVVSVFLVVVYVGAAVMFIILSISMLGGGGEEARGEFRGAAVAGMVMSIAAIALIAGGLFKAYTPPGQYTLSEAAQLLLADKLPVLGLLAIALAATLVEAIAVARRGE